LIKERRQNGRCILKLMVFGESKPMFVPEPVPVGLGEERRELKRILLFFQRSEFPGFDHPASLSQHRSSVNGAGQNMQHLSVW
jgi:hypothetical protein